MHINVRCCLCSGILTSLATIVWLVLWLSLYTTPELEILFRNNTSDYMLLFMIHSRADYEGRMRREAIRATWLSSVDHVSQDLGEGITYRFILGGKNLSEEASANITLEQEELGDLIVLGDVTDSHDSLTLRTLRGFQYAIENRFKFEYMFKCDDDTFVNLRAVANDLHFRERNDRLYWGEFVGACQILQDGIYAEYNWNICETYTPYAFGGGYVVSYDIVNLLSQNAPFLKQYKNEDVSVGAWLAPYNIEYKFDSRYNTGAVSRGCKRQFIVVHKIHTNQMFDYFNALTNDGRMCNRQNKWFGWHGFIYNWNALPSKCCKRRRRIP